MPDTNRTHPPGPAQIVGGARHKLVRRNNRGKGANELPLRSNTMPVLNSGSAAASLVSSVSSVGSSYVKDKQTEDNHDQQQLEELPELEDLVDKMQFYPPSGAVK